MTDETPTGAAPDPAQVADAPAQGVAATPGDVAPPAPAGPRTRATSDRPRGLDAPFAPGGGDDATPERIADERRMTRLLVLMVVLLVAVPTVLTLIAFVGQLLAMRGG